MFWGKLKLQKQSLQKKLVLKNIGQEYSTKIESPWPHALAFSPIPLNS